MPQSSLHAAKVNADARVESSLAIHHINDSHSGNYLDLIYETDKLAYGQFCHWNSLPVPDPEKNFLEQPEDIRVVRDLSTVEELEMMLAMSRYTLQLFDGPEKCTKDQIALRMEAYGKQLRASFIAKHGYKPEDSVTPYIPVTIDGPQDHDVYYAKEYP